MARKVPRLKAEEVIRALRQHGFTLVSQRGSHQKWYHKNTGKKVIVPYHQGKLLPLGTLKSIIEGSGIPKSEFQR